MTPKEIVGHIDKNKSFFAQYSDSYEVLDSHFILVKHADGPEGGLANAILPAQEPMRKAGVLRYFEYVTKDGIDKYVHKFYSGEDIAKSPIVFPISHSLKGDQ